MDLRRRRPNSGLPNKLDTPSRPGSKRLNKKLRKKMKLSTRKIFEALKEESEEDKTEVQASVPLRADIKPVHCKSLHHPSRLSCFQKAGNKAPAVPVYKIPVRQPSPANHPDIQVNPIQGSFEDEEITSERNASSSMDTDTTFNHGDEDGEDCSSSVLTTPNSFPSPEIFRNVTSPIREDLTGVHAHIKNSTLLDVSNAKAICMHHSPNLSDIDASTIHTAKKFDIILNREHGPENKTAIGLSESDTHLVRKFTPKLSSGKPFLFKKVSFKSPVISETIKGEHASISAHKTSHLSPPQQIEPDAELSTTGEISFKASSLQVTLQRPLDHPEKARIFDFIDEDDRNAYFQKMSERCVKLQSFTFFHFATQTSVRKQEK